MMEVKDLTISYGETVIIKEVSFTLEEGKLTALLGVNGAGKTTLLKSLCGIKKPCCGSCKLHGVDVLHLSERQRARLVGYIPQRYVMAYDILCLDVVLMGISPHLKAFTTPTKAHGVLAVKMLEKVGMKQVAYKNFLTLSEGQKQMVLIARGLMQQTKVMLFDEPDSALDFNNKHHVLNTMQTLMKEEQRIGLITLHDPNLALSYCDDIILLKNGVIFQKFAIKETSKELLEHYLGGLYQNIAVVTHEGQFIAVKRG